MRLTLLVQNKSFYCASTRLRSVIKMIFWGFFFNLPPFSFLLFFSSFLFFPSFLVVSLSPGIDHVDDAGLAGVEGLAALLGEWVLGQGHAPLAWEGGGSERVVLLPNQYWYR